MKSMVIRLLADDEAGTLVEYGLVLALVARAAIVAMHKLGTRATLPFKNAKKHL